MTNLSLAPEEVWRFYNGRADCENRIKELKLDFAADGFFLRSFQGTEAVLQLNCLLFNLLAAFKDEILENPSPTLATLRHSLFVLCGLLRASARRPRLFLGLLNHKTRYRFAQLLMRLEAPPPNCGAPASGSSATLAKAPLGPRRFPLLLPSRPGLN